MNEYALWLLGAAVLLALLAGWMRLRRSRAKRGEDAARLDATQRAKTEQVAAHAAAAQKAQKTADDTARVAAERAAAQEASRRAEEEAQRFAAEREAAEFKAAERMRHESERVAAEAQARRTEELRLAEQRRAAEEEVRRAAENRAAEDAARRASEREAAERAARMEASRVEAERRVAEQAALKESEQARAAEQARQTAEREAADKLAAEQSAPKAAEHARASVPKTPADTIVMVADDSKVVRVKTSRLLAQHHYQVALAADGLEAAQQIENTVPHVLITDVEMPGIDGFQLTKWVRDNPRTAHIPVIMITAADDKHREEAMRAGVSVLLGKPYPDEALIAHIEASLGRAEVHA